MHEREEGKENNTKRRQDKERKKEESELENRNKMKMKIRSISTLILFLRSTYLVGKKILRLCKNDND